MCLHYKFLYAILPTTDLQFNVILDLLIISGEKTSNYFGNWYPKDYSGVPKSSLSTPKKDVNQSPENNIPVISKFFYKQSWVPLNWLQTGDKLGLFFLKLSHWVKFQWQTGFCKELVKYPLRDLKNKAIERKKISSESFLLLKHFSCSF